MTDQPCDSRRGQLAMDALGRLDDAEHAELEEHLATCGGCRAAIAELRSTVGALDTSVTGAAGAPEATVPPQLTRAVFAELDPAGTVVHPARRRRRVLVACGSIAAVVIAAVAVSMAMTRPGTPTRTVALHGTGGVTATAVLVEKPWGTSLTIHEEGLAAGQTYTVSMDDPRGRWWAAGTYRATGSGPVEATMACAARFTSIYEIRVTDSSGRTVLSNGSNPTY